MRLAETGFLLILFAGIWLTAVGGGDEGVEEAEGGQWDGGGVVGVRPEQVAFDGAQGMPVAGSAGTANGSGAGRSR